MNSHTDMTQCMLPVGTCKAEDCSWSWLSGFEGVKWPFFFFVHNSYNNFNECFMFSCKIFDLSNAHILLSLPIFYCVGGTIRLPQDVSFHSIFIASILLYRRRNEISKIWPMCTVLWGGSLAFLFFVSFFWGDNQRGGGLWSASRAF